MIRTLQILLPKTFLLENVVGLLRRRDVLVWILSELSKMDGCRYHVDARVVNASDHGLPMSRPRLFIVGIDKSLLPAVFQFPWPEEIGCVPLELCLDEWEKEVTLQDMPPERQSTARHNFMQVFREVIEKLQVNPLTSHVVADIDAGWGAHWMDGVVPCLTRSRSSAESHWVMNRGRRLRVWEAARLMGLPSSQLRLSGSLSCNQVGKLLGNGMAVNVLERLLRRLLSCAGLVPLSAMTARWESIGSATATAAALHK